MPTLVAVRTLLFQLFVIVSLLKAEGHAIMTTTNGAPHYIETVKKRRHQRNFFPSGTSFQIPVDNLLTTILHLAANPYVLMTRKNFTEDAYVHFLNPSDDHGVFLWVWAVHQSLDRFKKGEKTKSVLDPKQYMTSDGFCGFFNRVFRNEQMSYRSGDLSGSELIFRKVKSLIRDKVTVSMLFGAYTRRWTAIRPDVEQDDADYVLVEMRSRSVPMTPSSTVVNTDEEEEYENDEDVWAAGQRRDAEAAAVATSLTLIKSSSLPDSFGDIGERSATVLLVPSKQQMLLTDIYARAKQFR